MKLITFFISLVIYSTLPSMGTQTPKDLRIIEVTKADDYARVKELIAQKGDLTIKDDYGNTALLWSSYRNNMLIAQALIAAGAQVNAQTNFSSSPLLIAATRGHTAIAHALINGGRMLIYGMAIVFPLHSY